VTLIAISGIDGSGKTTLANELVTMLAAAGFSARYCYGRFVPKRLRTIIHLFRKLRFGTTQEHGYPSNYAGERRNLVRNPLISWALKGTIGTAYVIGTSRKLRRLLSQHEFIVCDRYLLDTWILDACLGTGGLSRSDIRLLQVLTDFLPRPDFGYLVDIPRELALSRKADHLPGDLLDEAILNFRRAGESLGLVFIDGTKPQACNAKQIADQLGLRG